MLLGDLEQSQGGAVWLPLSLLPCANRVRAHVERRRKDGLRELHLVADLSDLARPVVGRRRHLRFSNRVPGDASRCELTCGPWEGRLQFSMGAGGSPMADGADSMGEHA